MTPRRAVLAPALILFSIMVAHALLETARDALFLARLGPQRLAWAYLAIAAAALLAVAAVRRWGGVRDPRRTLVTFLIAAALGTAILALTITTTSSMVFVLYVWTGLVATLVVPSFWTLIDRSLRIAEAKRVFGAIGAGGVLGAMVGSALASGLGRVVAANHLVTAGALAFGGATVTAFLLGPKPTDDELVLNRRRDEVLSQRSRRYVKLLVAIGVISTVAITLADLTFKHVLAARVAPEDLATVFGAIYTGLNVIGLVIQLAVTPRILAHWGVGNALLVLPVLLLTTASGFALTGVLAAIVALKLADGGLRYSLHRVGSEILFLPLPAGVRDRWKPVVDAVGQRGGQAIAALLVFALGAIGAGARLLGAASAAVALVWVVAILIGRRAYIVQFRDMLRAGEIERDARIPDLDTDSIRLLTEALSSPDEVEALAALELLARGGHVPALVLYHPQQSVVRRALSFLERDLRPGVARVLGHLIEHSDPKIRAATLAAASRAGSHRPQLEAAMTDPDADVRAAALVGLSRDPQHATRAASGLDELARGTTADRVALAHAIGYSPDEFFRTLLYQLLGQGEPAVMREVLSVLARAPQLADLERLLGLLEHSHVRGPVRRVFIACGQRSLDLLIAALDNPRTPIGVRRHLPRTISLFRSRMAADALVARLIREPDRTTEFKILRALGRMRANDPAVPIDASVVREYLGRAVADAARYSTLRDRLLTEDGRSPTAELLLELIAEKKHRAIDRAFRSLGILHPRGGLRSVHAAIVGSNESRRSVAREIVESLIATDLRSALLAVLDDLAPEERRARLGPLAPGPFPTYEAFLATLLADPSESLKCVAAHHVAERQLVGLRGDLIRLRPLVGAPLVIYAFDQAIVRLDA